MKTVEQLMSKDLEVVTPQTPLQLAAQKMADNNIGFLVVCEANRLVGCLTDRDLAVNVVARGIDPKEKRVWDVMTRNVLTIERGDKLQKAYKLLSEHRLRRLVVVDINHRPVGVITLDDLAAGADEAEFSKIGKVYRDIAEPLVS